MPRGVKRGRGGMFVSMIFFVVLCGCDAVVLSVREVRGADGGDDALAGAGDDGAGVKRLVSVLRVSC
jgi:hypothetical protein